MPMYEYECQACGSQFTLLRRMDQDDTDVCCGQCGGSKVERLFSLFAAHSKERNGFDSSMASSGGCSGGVCSTGTCSSGLCG